MKKEEFERLLDVCCGALTHEAKKSGFSTSLQFENRVREVLDDLLKDESEMRVDFDSPPQAFPDIALGEYGVEVKFTLADTWKSIANSIQESQRVQSVKYIYIVFGKMGGKPEVRWGDYEKSGSSCITVGGFPPHKFAWPLFYGLLSRSSGPRNFD